MNINVMTFNIQHGFDYAKQDGINLQLMADTIKKLGGDIVGLNEVRDAGRDPDYTAQAKIIAEQLGYHWFFAKTIDFPGGPYGNGLVSKYPILSAEKVSIEDPFIKDEPTYYETRCILKAVIDVPGFCGGLTVLISHFGLAKSEQHNAVTRVREVVADLKGPIVFMGDLNMQPDDEILQPIFTVMKDTATAFEAPKFSFPSDEPDRKIDYIFVDKDTAVVSADIPAVVASDHRPCIATIRV